VQVGRKDQIQDYRVNEQIRAETVRVIDGEGQQVGIMPRQEALQRARESELDLVQVAPNAEPPVCRLLDFGKFKYRQKKKQKQTHHRSQLKEIRIGLTTEEHDLEFKAGRVKEFLGENHRVLVTMRLKGRQRAHGDMAVEHMAEFGKRFEDMAKFEKLPQRDSAWRVSMLLAPK